MSKATAGMLRGSGRPSGYHAEELLPMERAPYSTGQPAAVCVCAGEDGELLAALCASTRCWIQAATLLPTLLSPPLSRNGGFKTKARVLNAECGCPGAGSATSAATDASPRHRQTSVHRHQAGAGAAHAGRCTRTWTRLMVMAGRYEPWRARLIVHCSALHAATLVNCWGAAFLCQYAFNWPSSMTHEGASGSESRTPILRRISDWHQAHSEFRPSPPCHALSAART